MATKKQRAKKSRSRRLHQETTRSVRRDPIPDAMTELKELRQHGLVVESKRTTVPHLKGPVIRVVLNTSDINGVARGLTVGATEDIFLVLGDTYPDVPPGVVVNIEERFIGYPHVICGYQLCIYLDPKREWHPTFGMEEAIVRTWEWFDNAANDRFDPRVSLFHAVGGAPPTTRSRPTVVVRSAPPLGLPLAFQSALSIRSLNRLDLVGWCQTQISEPDIPLPTFVVPKQLSFGVRRDVAAVATQVEQAGGYPISDFCVEIARLAKITQEGEPLYLCLIVAHPTESDLPTLLVGRIPEQIADRIREGQSDIVASEVPIDWLPTSDERPDATTRRDVSRPAAGLQGSTVEIWGCGGLGSWIAELVVRANPEKVVLRDHGLVHRGHLVRQNYTELDVGGLKGEKLAERLQAVNEETEVVFGSLSALDAIESGNLPLCDLVIDATISETVAYRLDQVAARCTQGPLLIQVATDIATASLGLVVVAPPSFSGGPATVDQRAADVILDRDDLEPFHTFWDPPLDTAELTPAPGCSVPTYHGAAADLAAITGSMVSLAGAQLTSPVAGIYLFASSHSGVSPPMMFQPIE